MQTDRYKEASNMLRRKDKGFTLIELLIVVAIIGIIAAIAIPNLLNAIDRGKQKRSMADLRSVGTACEEYAIDMNVYPVAASLAALTPSIEPLYIRKSPTADGWNRTIVVNATTTEYTICSNGKDGTGSCATDALGPRTSFNDSITFANGQFVTWPEGQQR
jgi:general secretion pathway protein G